MSEIGDFDRVAGGFAPLGDEPTRAPLFRREALEAARGSGLGKPIADYPLSWSALSLILFAMFLAGGAVLFSLHYTRKETVRGVVREVGGDARIVAPAAGVIATLDVTEGQRVRAGDRLLSVSTARLGVDGRMADQSAIGSIDSEVANLKARLASLRESSAVERDGRQTRLAALQSQLSTSQSIESASRERLNLAEDALAKAEPAASKGFLSLESMRRRRDEIISLRQAIDQSVSEEAGLRGQIADLRAAQAEQPFALQQGEGELLDRIATAQRERDGYVSQRGYVVRAPIAGVVSAVQVGRGQSVDPVRPLMTISAPAHVPTAELYVPSRAIGFLRAGQHVRVRYDAFPFERFGFANGTVQSVSPTVLRPEEVQAPLQVTEPVYRVVVRLERSSVRAYGKDYAVNAGSSLTADIILDSRSLASSLFEPILALKGHL